MHSLAFDTVIGTFEISWNERGLTRLKLPAAGSSAIRSAEAPATARTVPAHIEKLVSRIRGYANGASDDFADVAVVLGGCDAFRCAIYTAARTVTFGRTVTYGELAAAAGFSGMAREAGAALGRNPVPLVVPCHRILAAGNRAGGFSAPGGVATKLSLLRLEGVDLSPPAPTQHSFAF